MNQDAQPYNRILIVVKICAPITYIWYELYYIKGPKLSAKILVVDLTYILSLISSLNEEKK